MKNLKKKGTDGCLFPVLVGPCLGLGVAGRASNEARLRRRRLDLMKRTT